MSREEMVELYFRESSIKSLVEKLLSRFDSLEKESITQKRRRVQGFVEQSIVDYYRINRAL